jgi:hypothetical protein
MWNKPYVKCGAGLMNTRSHVKLAWAASIPLYRDIKKYKKRKFATKASMPATTLLCVKHLCIDLTVIPLRDFAA